jgi:hypothetical protein
MVVTIAITPATKAGLEVALEVTIHMVPQILAVALGVQVMILTAQATRALVAIKAPEAMEVKALALAPVTTAAGMMTTITVVPEDLVEMTRMALATKALVVINMGLAVTLPAWVMIHTVQAIRALAAINLALEVILQGWVVMIHMVQVTKALVAINLALAVIHPAWVQVVMILTALAAKVVASVLDRMMMILTVLVVAPAVKVTKVMEVVTKTHLTKWWSYRPIFNICYK